MAGSLKTKFFNLVKYAANDITSWLTDFNGNMDKIDKAMNQNKTAAQTAQDGVDNLEAEYESLLTVVNGHTTSIDANEKAIAANSASIKKLNSEMNNIVTYDSVVINLNDENVTKIQDVITIFTISGRRIGNGFVGSNILSTTAGTISTYHRQGSVPGIGEDAYITDMLRITGNPFNLPDGNWYSSTSFLFDGENSGTGFGNVIGYVASSGYTVYGYASKTVPQTSMKATSSLNVFT